MLGLLHLEHHVHPEHLLLRLELLGLLGRQHLLLLACQELLLLGHQELLLLLLGLGQQLWDLLHTCWR